MTIPFQEEAQVLYTTAYSSYERNDYPTAVQLFTRLALSAPFCAHYWKGLASSEQMNKNYNAALHAWCQVALLDRKNPLPHFHAAECYLSLHEKMQALKALNAAEALLNLDRTEDDRLKQRIDLLKARWCTHHA